jgi:hypothetical protein
MVGSHEIEVLALDDAETSIQRAMTPIRREALDLHWMPWAQENDSEEVREATRLLYACLDDPTLRAAARYCGGGCGVGCGEGCGEGRGEVRGAAAWSAARYAAGAAAWDRRFGVGRGVVGYAAWAAAYAAGAAAWDAAGAAAWDAAGAAAWAKINHRVGAAIIKEVLS